MKTKLTLKLKKLSNSNNHDRCSTSRWLVYNAQWDQIISEFISLSSISVHTIIVWILRHKNLIKTKVCKVEKTVKGSLDSIPSPSSSVKIQIMGRKVSFEKKSLLTMPIPFLTFPPIIWIFTEGEGDEIESRLSS